MGNIVTATIMLNTVTGDRREIEDEWSTGGLFEQLQELRTSVLEKTNW